MMKASHIFLCPKISRTDALTMMGWFEDSEVTRYLHEGQHTSREILEAVERSGLTDVTHLFSRGGSTYMICTHAENPVGLLRLVVKNGEAEIVIIIGDKKRWGTGIGGQAIACALRDAFFERRVNLVVANVHPKNERSIRVFRAAGFTVHTANDRSIKLHLTRQDYLQELYEKIQA